MMKTTSQYQGPRWVQASFTDIFSLSDWSPSKVKVQEDPEEGDVPKRASSTEGSLRLLVDLVDTPVDIYFVEKVNEKVNKKGLGQ